MSRAIVSPVVVADGQTCRAAASQPKTDPGTFAATTASAIATATADSAAEYKVSGVITIHNSYMAYSMGVYLILIPLTLLVNYSTPRSLNAIHEAKKRTTASVTTSCAPWKGC
jgi:hypothetical protein